MPESPRIAELRRRVHTDPASIAFAQLAEEYRRAGNYDDAVAYCRSGLARHPGYLSARVTLGRALTELGQLDEAEREFELVLRSAPDNLAAIRGMAEIHQRRGDMPGALAYYQRAMVLARFDPELEESVHRIHREMGAVAPAAAEPVQPEQPKQTRTDLIDFDALLSDLGAPNASPPPFTEMLLAGDSPQQAHAVIPELPAQPLAADNDPFAALEAQIQQIQNPAIPGVADEQPVSEFLRELEKWLDVLVNERERLSNSPA